MDAVKRLTYHDRQRQQLDAAGASKRVAAQTSSSSLTASRNTLCTEMNMLKLHREGSGPDGSTCHFSSCLAGEQEQHRHKGAEQTQP